MKNNSSRYLGFLLMGVGLVSVAAGISGLTRPREYEARARLKIAWQKPFDIDEADLKIKGLRTDQDFVRREILDIQSDRVLTNAVSRLDLGFEWNKKYKNGQMLKTDNTLLRLRSQIDVRPVSNTTLVDICATSGDPTEAALIANTIAEVYTDWKRNQGRRIVESGIAELVKQLKLQEQRTQKAEDNLEGLRKALAIPSPEPSDDFLSTNFPAYAEAKRNLGEAKDIERLIARKIKIEQEDLSIPIDSPVLIIERAVPAAAPSGRQGQLGAILLLVGLAIFSSGIVIVRNSKAGDSSASA